MGLQLEISMGIKGKRTATNNNSGNKKRVSRIGFFLCMPRDLWARAASKLLPNA
jgi:hypothetical protein